MQFNSKTNEETFQIFTGILETVTCLSLPQNSEIMAE